MQYLGGIMSIFYGFTLLEKRFIQFLFTPVLLELLLFLNGIYGLQLICIAILGSVCLWGVFVTIKLLQTPSTKSPVKY
ncbi:Uncharacterised protein [[Pasteurella] aerogenes]|nr:Uncharacterised protein [[Pasteurella] aerogenes]